NIVILGRFQAAKNKIVGNYAFSKNKNGAYYDERNSSVRISNVKISYYNRKSEKLKKNMVIYDFCGPLTHIVSLSKMTCHSCSGIRRIPPANQGNINDCLTWKGYEYYSDDADCSPVADVYPVGSRFVQCSYVEFL
ncbi:hypothetical protein MXB_5025, partial [Myxobolus squamalis]